MIRLRHVAEINPPKSLISHLPDDTDVVFAPMEALADGLGGLDVSIRKPLRELRDGSYSYFAEGDLLVAKVTPCFENGKKAIAKPLPGGIGFATSEVHVIRLTSETVDRRYLKYVFCSEPFRFAGIASMTGAGGLRRVSEEAILNYRLPESDLPTQQRIADFLDRETARIDQLIEKKQRIVELIRPKWEALIHQSRGEAEIVRLGFVADRKARSVARKDEEIYIPLGLLNWGRGLFHKAPTSGAELGDSDFFWVEEGDLIFSGQFAWEGAVAYAGPNEHGCVVSHRYPIYRGKRAVSTSYLFAYFRTEPGQYILAESSRGAAGRNRPLNTSLLEKEKIPIPSVAVQEAVEKMVNFESVMRSKMLRSVELLKVFRSALITAAVTGQIDVDNWKRRGDTDRRLEAIEEGMRA